MMESVIIAVIVGLLSGLLGAVIGPVVTHRLIRRQREERRSERRHAELRAMLESKMKAARERLAMTDDIFEALVHENLSTPEAHARLEVAELDRFDIWRPHRIDDGGLEDMAEKLDALDEELIVSSVAMIDIFEQAPAPTDKQEILRKWYDEMSSGVKPELKAVFRKIDLRLDELGW